MLWLQLPLVWKFVLIITKTFMTYWHDVGILAYYRELTL